MGALVVLVEAVSGVAVGLAGVRLMSAPLSSVGNGDADVEGLSFWKTHKVPPLRVLLWF